ncbi:hypothetical protein [Tautonia sociabilis]|uniref:Uncharacterized protein n=1 Tax=Tautonia sociabilis TaxID=2080755 RepID=A0A432MIL0_9BACT|nr:hypothetical protein [Tautonia sociabilis]RUL87060.1 hypothetical protein TsocGM_14050 [Tautonia sociabilis]
MAIFNVSSGRRTRMLAGHEGAVYALAPSPDRRWLADRLGEAAGLGCATIVVLDVVHEAGSPWESRQTRWIRDLMRRGVIVLVADEQDRPSLSAGGHRALAQAILDSPQGEVDPISLGRFGSLLIDGVEALTSRRQRPRLYVPFEKTASQNKALIDPEPPPR